MQDIVPRVKEDDPRFLRTRRALVEAIITLVDAEPETPISITRLVEHAGLTRPTFYQHFNDMAGALQRAALERIGEAFPLASQHAADDMAKDTVAHVLPALEHLHLHRPFYIRVIETAASAGFFEELVQFVRQRMLIEELPAHADRQDTRAFNALTDVVAGGSMWLVVRWLRGQVSGTPRDIAHQMAAISEQLHRIKRPSEDA